MHTPRPRRAYGQICGLTRVNSAKHALRRGSRPKALGPVEAMLLLPSSLRAYPGILALCIASVLRPESRFATETIRASKVSVAPMR
jgi:hypothetical protein